MATIEAKHSEVVHRDSQFVSIMDPDIPWRLKLIDWLFHQGVSTVLLFGLGVGIWVKLPAMMDAIDRGYQQNAKDHKAIADTYLQSAKLHANTVDKLVMSQEREQLEHQRMMIELLKRSDITADELTEAIQAAQDQ